LSETEPTSATSTSPEGAKMGVRNRGETRKRCLPLELRLQLYDEVHRLRGQGLSYSDIIERIHRSIGVWLYRSNVSYWVRAKKEPLGRVNRFDGKPSPELAYVVGVLLSDGSLLSRNRQRDYGLWLGVKDREFAERFGRDLAKLLGRRNPYKAQWSQSKQWWVVKGYSILLFNHLDKPWHELKPYIEHRKDCVAAFLRAFFDGEGSVCERRLTVYNADKQLLIYIKGLLKRYFDIDATGPHINVKSGTVFHFPHTGRVYKRNKNHYCVYVRADSLLRFYEAIAFTIRRKQRRLAEAVKQ